MSTADIVTAGDSWATLSADAIRNISGETVHDVSVGGTTASWWHEQRSPVPDLLEEAQAAGCHSVYLSIGALDVPMENTPDYVVASHIKELVLPLLREGVRVIHAGYNDPWYPRFPQLMGGFAYREPLYNYIDLTHLNPDVTLLPDGLHLAPEDYQHRVEYCWWWLGEPRGAS